MSSVFDDIAKKIASAGAPVIGTLIGTAIGGPAGALAGSLAGKAMEAVAESLGTDPTPAAIGAAIDSDPAAPAKIQAAEARAGEMVRVYEIEAQRAADAQTAEIAQGFGSWNWRRNMAHYSAWGMLVASGLATLYGAFSGLRELTVVASVFTAMTGVVMAWIAVNSGGKAATDAVKAWRGQ